MWFHSLLASWKSGLSRRRRPKPQLARRGTRLVLEQLEDRSLPSSYSAANVSALIADITAANAAGGTNTISLTAPTTSPYVLTGVNNTTWGNTGLPVVAAHDNLSIIGNGDTIERSTASGTPDFRLLAVGGGSLTLANLTLQNGVSTSPLYGGGAIYSHGVALTLSGVTVQNNRDYAPGTVEGVGGGAIYAVYGSLTMQNGTVLEGNEAYGEYAFGGAVVAKCYTVNISNTTFTGNTADGAGGAGCGGALFVDDFGLSDVQVLLTNTTLTNNNATCEPEGEGGGLYANFTGVSLSNCTVESNTAGEGGGVYVGVGAVSLSNCTVESNSAIYGGGLYVAEIYLSGLYVASGRATLSSCTVESNSALYGGGLYVAGYLCTATLSSCTVESNTAKWGGGLYVGAEGTATLSSCTVESNSATYSGGGMYIASADGLLSAATVYLDPFTVANTINNTDSTGLNGSTANIDGTYILT